VVSDGKRGISCRIDSDTYDKFAAKAATRGMTPSQFVKTMIYDYVGKLPKTKAKKPSDAKNEA